MGIWDFLKITWLLEVKLVFLHWFVSSVSNHKNIQLRMPKSHFNELASCPKESFPLWTKHRTQNATLYGRKESPSVHQRACHHLLNHNLIWQSSSPTAQSQRMIRKLLRNLGYTASSRKLIETLSCQMGEIHPLPSSTIHTCLIRLKSVHLENNPIIDLETYVQKGRFWLLPRKGQPKQENTCWTSSKPWR